jgi:cytochrome oxidase Cu insertion factor (SCO1/SenC/PrrC family)
VAFIRRQFLDARQLRFELLEPPDEYNVMHSANIYLINPKGEWEIIYDVQQLQEPAKVAADIESILHE